MGHNNAKYYCLEHPKRIGKGFCKECRSTMCSSCLEENETFCPACRREIFRDSGRKVSATSLIIPLIGGVLGLTVGYFFSRHQNPHESLYEFLPYGILFFFLGISLFYTFFLYRNSDLFDEMSSIPFLSIKFKVIIYILSVVTLVPAIFYLYRVFLYIVTSKERRL